MNSFEEFSQLHHSSTPLLLGNIWDVSSAKLFESSGYKAIGTSSQAVANTFGYEDGEELEFETLVLLAKRVVKVVGIPFTVDIEGGYSRTAEGIAENIKKLHDVGVVGVNVEDTVGNADRHFRPVSEFQKILATVVDILSQSNHKIFLNIRTDGFLMGAASALQETLVRIKAYENSGASGIFVPCITSKSDIQEVVNSTRLPVNVMCMPDLPDFEELKLLGVKRISIGPFLRNYANKKAEDMMKAILAQNSFSPLF
jgi:PEP phosphonomutase and related enzymes